MKDNRPLIFHLSASRALAKEVSKLLNYPLGEAESYTFYDGEEMVKPISEVKDRDIILIQSTSYPQSKHLMEILIFVDSLRKNKSGKITLVTPYFGYARQDRQIHAKDPITASLAARLIESCGVDEIIFIDIHTKNTPSFFHIKTHNIEMTNTYKQLFLKVMEENNYKKDEVMVFSPDHGSESRGIALASALGVTFGEIYKIRPKVDETRIKDIEGNPNGKVVFLIDDIVDTGSTILEAVDALKGMGAKAIYVGFTHAVLKENNYRELVHHDIDKIFFSNSIELSFPHEEAVCFSIASEIAKAIRGEIDG